MEAHNGETREIWFRTPKGKIDMADYDGFRYKNDKTRNNLHNIYKHFNKFAGNNNDILRNHDNLDIKDIEGT